MLRPDALAAFSLAQKRLLVVTYNHAWRHGVANYTPRERPYDAAAEASKQRDEALLTGAALLAARARRQYVPPLTPDAYRRAIALAPALHGVNSMTGQIAQVVPSPADLAAAEAAVAAGSIEPAQMIGYAWMEAVSGWAGDNAWRLDGGDSAAWAGEQSGYAEAASAGGDLLDWETEDDDHVCFPAGTLVETICGPRPIEALRVGERVLTHAGRYRPITGTMVRSYRGRLVEIRAGEHGVVATANHPVLCRQQGELRWRRADQLFNGDTVLAQNVHDGGRTRLADVNDGVSALAEVGVTPCLSRGVPVPVGPVDLDGELFADQEVDAVATYSHLAAEGNRSLRQGSACGALGARFAGVSTPTGAIAEPIAFASRGLRAEAFAARRAGHMNGWPVTFFRAVLGVGVGPELLAATSADARREVWRGTGPARIGAVRPRATLERLETGPTGGADALDMAVLHPAGARAIAMSSGMARTDRKGCLAAGTVQRDHIAQRHPETRARAELASRSRIGQHHDHAAGSTSALSHPHILPAATLVYNLEVDEDHTYVAGGLVVHNCPDCESLGQMGPMPLEEWPTTPGSGDTACNVGCRCSFGVAATMPATDSYQSQSLSEDQQAAVDAILERRSVALNGLMPDMALLS